MKIPLKIMLFGLMLLAANSLKAQNVIIKFDNGGQFTPLITAVQKITFTDEQFFVDMKSGTDNTYNISDIRKIYFGNVTDNNIPQSADQQKIIVYPNPASTCIMLSNLPQTGLIRIYAMDGSIVYEQAISDTQLQIDVSALADDLYIIIVNQSTLKFIRQ